MVSTSSLFRARAQHRPLFESVGSFPSMVPTRLHLTRREIKGFNWGFSANTCTAFIQCHLDVTENTKAFWKVKMTVWSGSFRTTSGMFLPFSYHIHIWTAFRFSKTLVFCCNWFAHSYLSKVMYEQPVWSWSCTGKFCWLRRYCWHTRNHFSIPVSLLS